MSPKNNYDDEALARALQIEYEREYRRRSMQQHLDVNEIGPSTRGSSTRNTSHVPAVTPLPPPPMGIPSAPLSNSFYEDDFDGNETLNNVVGSHRGIPATVQPSFPRSSFIMAEDRFGNVEFSDEEHARKLEQDMIDEERRRKQRKQHLQQQRDSYRATSSMNRGSNNVNTEFPTQRHIRDNSMSTSHTSPTNNRRAHNNLPTDTNFVQENHNLTSSQYRNSSRNSNMTEYPVVTATAILYTDEELAMRLEQEMRDEELARQAFVEEQIRQSSIAAQSMHNNSSHRRRAPRSSSCCCRLFQCALMLTVAGVATLLLLFFVFNPDDVGNFIPNPDEFREEDPFNSANKDDANLWRTKGGTGLNLVVVNALDDIWHPYFFTAVDQWDEGVPDALSLTIEDASPDSTCNALDGKLKVCNGNYGATNWRGINKILLENGWIYSSAARMNEYYVTANDGDQRQYTMCHEIGHGFGLPHTDENFFNKDLGNCMDYTNKPEVNKQPAYANFKFLSQLYGTLDGSPVPTDDTTTVESASNNTEAPQKEVKESWKDKLKNLGGKRRRLLPSNVARSLTKVDSIADSGLYRSEMHGWRVLHESAFGHAYEYDLGDGYVVQIHALNA